jgi:phospholipid/cholesterol/gamma-HCH transport system permease protein
MNSPAPGFSVHQNGEQIVAEGDLDIYTLEAAKQAMRNSPSGQASFDVGGLKTLDTPGALYLCELQARGMRLTGVKAEHQNLLELVGGLPHEPLPEARTIPRWRQLIVQLGKSADDALRDGYDVIDFTGRTVSATLGALLHPARLHPASISRHVEETGINALPIIGLLAVMISIVIGYQGVAQLRPFGGEDFTVNLVAVSVLREMGVLITSIMVAGRTGSAFTAEIGVMRARQEIDALQVMGLDPMTLLVVPRVIALMITLPLLAFFADIMGLLGGGAIAMVTLHLAPAQYLERVHTAVTYQGFYVGLVKAPVFAAIIAIIGCMHGLRVTQSASSVGQETTRAVVKSIFLVIVLDALFSIFFERLGV